MSKKHKKVSSKKNRRVSALAGTGFLGIAVGIAVIGVSVVTESADAEPAMNLTGVLFMTTPFVAMALGFLIYANFAPALRWISGELYKGQRRQQRRDAQELESAADGGDE